MATAAELKTRREALLAARSSGVARVSYDGKSIDYRSLAEIDRAIEALDREIAAAEGRRIVRQVRVTTAPFRSLHSVDEHIAVLVACADRDVERADAALKAHLDKALARYMGLSCPAVKGHGPVGKCHGRGPSGHARPVSSPSDALGPPNPAQSAGRQSCGSRQSNLSRHPCCISLTDFGQGTLGCAVRPYPHNGGLGQLKGDAK